MRANRSCGRPGATQGIPEAYLSAGGRRREGVSAYRRVGETSPSLDTKTRLARLDLPAKRWNVQPEQHVLSRHLLCITPNQMQRGRRASPLRRHAVTPTHRPALTPEPGLSLQRDICSSLTLPAPWAPLREDDPCLSRFPHQTRIRRHR